MQLVMDNLVLALLISKQRVNSINFYQNRLKITLFLPIKYKSFERCRLRFQTPVPPAAGGFALKPQLPLAA